jgi:predicted kinase
MDGVTRVPVGLILLVGPPASGKSSFARAWVDADVVVSCDAIRAELFGSRHAVGDDPAIFDEMDRRVVARLEAAVTVVVDATNVMPHARARMIAWARQYGRPVTALRFRVPANVLVRRNRARSGQARRPTLEVLNYAVAAARHTSRSQLTAEGVRIVDVPGEADGLSPIDAAATIRLIA